MNNRQLATILAGLRMLQRTVFVPAEIEVIATNDSEHDAMTGDEIDELCEALNGPDWHVVAYGNPFDGLTMEGPYLSFEEALEAAEGTDNNYFVTRLEEPAQ